MQSRSIKKQSIPWPLLPNDIIKLALQIETALQHFNQAFSSCEEMYLNQLHIISHCYYLVLLELGERQILMPLVDSNFKEHPEEIKTVALNLAEMINTISDKVRLIDHPWFYPHFVTAVSQILSDKFGYLGSDLGVSHRLLEKIIRFGRVG